MNDESDIEKSSWYDDFTDITSEISPIKECSIPLNENVCDIVVNKFEFESLVEFSSLCQATYSGNKELVLELLSEGENPNDVSHDGSTPLILAVERGHLDLVKSFLDAGADPSISRHDGMNACMLCLKRGDMRMFYRLWKHSELHKINEANSNKETVLFLAVKNNFSEVVKTLLSVPHIDVNCQCSNGLSPLMQAAFDGNRLLTKMLLSSGADLLLENKIGATALCLAVSRKHRGIIDLCLSEMKAKMRNTYLKSRIQLLSEPKSAFKDTITFYKDILFPVFLETRINMTNSIKIFQRLHIFNFLIPCAHTHMEDADFLNLVFHVSSCLMYSDTGYKYIIPKLTENFIHAEGPDLALMVLQTESFKSFRELRNTALLPLYAICETESGRHWLKDNLSLLYPHIKNFNINLLRMNYVYHGEDAKARIMFNRFLSVVQDVFSSNGDLQQRVLHKQVSKRKVMQKLLKRMHSKQFKSCLKSSSVMELSNFNQNLCLDSVTESDVLPRLCESVGNLFSACDSSDSNSVQVSSISPEGAEYATAVKKNMNPQGDSGSKQVFKGLDQELLPRISNKHVVCSTPISILKKVPKSKPCWWLADTLSRMSKEQTDETITNSSTTSSNFVMNSSKLLGQSQDTCYFDKYFEKSSSPSTKVQQLLDSSKTLDTDTHECTTIDDIIKDNSLKNIMLLLRSITQTDFQVDKVRKPHDVQGLIDFMYHVLLSMKPIAKPEDLPSFLLRQYLSSDALGLRFDFVPPSASSISSEDHKCTVELPLRNNPKITSEASLIVGGLNLRGTDLLKWWDTESLVIENKVFANNPINRNSLTYASKYFISVVASEFVNYSASRHLRQNESSLFSELEFRLFVYDGSCTEGLLLAETVQHLMFSSKLDKGSRWYQTYFSLSRALILAFRKCGLNPNVLLFNCHSTYSLRSGLFGTYLGICSDGRGVVVRRMSFPLTGDRCLRADYMKNIKHEGIQHENLHCVMDAIFCQWNVSIYVVSIICEYNLEQYFAIHKKQHTVTRVNVQLFVLQLLNALQYLHGHPKPILHGRLKPSNVYITISNQLKIADFFYFDILPLVYGVQQNSGAGGMISSNSWRSQELINSLSAEEAKNTYTKESDVQVAGMLVYYIVSLGLHPYGESDKECQKKIKVGMYDLMEIPSDLEGQDLIMEMLHHMPYKRISMENIMRHPYFWTLEQRFQFLLALDEKLHSDLKKSDFVLKILEKSCIEAKNWVSSVPLELLELKDKQHTTFENNLHSFLRFASYLQSVFEILPEPLRRYLESPSKYVLCTFPTVFMSLFEILRHNQIAQRQLGLESFFYSN